MQYLLLSRRIRTQTRPDTGYSNGTLQGEAAYRTLTKAYPFRALPDANLNTAQWRVAPTGPRLALWNQQWSRFKA